MNSIRSVHIAKLTGPRWVVEVRYAGSSTHCYCLSFEEAWHVLQQWVHEDTHNQEEDEA